MFDKPTFLKLKQKALRLKCFFVLVYPAGLEPAASRVGVSRSIQLGYG